MEGDGEHMTGESSDELLKEGVNKNNNNTSLSLGIDALDITPTSLLCSSTNIHYPTSGAMKLLQSYDDGLNSNDNDDSGGGSGGGGGIDDNNNDEILVSLETGEPVFCRICREGLHDVNTDYLETTAPSNPPQQSNTLQQQWKMMRMKDLVRGMWWLLPLLLWQWKQKQHSPRTV